jgi:hypothetical protein
VYELDFPAQLRALGVTNFRKYSWAGCVQPGWENHPNRALAASLVGCSVDELLIRGFSFCIAKS